MCGHALHLKCFHEHCDHTKLGAALSPADTNVPCPLCRHNVDQSAFVDKRRSDTESKYIQKDAASTWSYNVSSGVWTVLADAPFEHDDFFVLEQPKQTRIVSVSNPHQPEYSGLAYNIADDTWEAESPLPTIPLKHCRSPVLVEMMLP